MRNIFVINPYAGSKKLQKNLCDEIKKIGNKENLELEMYFTKSKGDGESFVRKLAESGEKVRIYACGGDGTLNEIVNGVVGAKNIELGFIPMGTGNDFLRNFGKAEDFLNLERQIKGKSILIDAMRYNDRVGINVINCGFDCSVVSKVESLRNNKIVPKGMAYSTGVILSLIKMPTEKLTFKFDDGTILNQRFLLFLVANGSYYGGGYKAASEAKVNDGLLDVMIVNCISRAQFIGMVNKYKAGNFLGTALASKIVNFKKCKSLSITSETNFDLCVDGEINKYEKVEFSIIPGCINFVIPEGCFY